MAQEYAAENVVSTVPQHKWRLTLWILTGTILGGSILVILLALGAANPPRAGALAWQSDSAEDWPLLEDTETVNLYLAPPPLPAPSFTLELSASNSGDVDSAWGVWLESGDTVYTILISREGYMSVSDDDVQHWTEFMHIKSDVNKIYVDVTTDFSAALRINDEIAWTGMLTFRDNPNWGIAQYGEPVLSWEDVRIYAS